MKNKKCKVVSTLMLWGMTFWQLLLVPTVTAGQFDQPIYEKNSLYHRIFVYQNGSVITLQFNKRSFDQIQSQVDLSNLRLHMLEYTTLTFCGLLYNPQPEKILVVGLGGGVIPREMRNYFPSIEIDVVEIDPEIPKVATQFFSFHNDNKLKVHIEDGRMFIKKQLRRKPVPKYDLVILDAFNSDYIPFHLMTKEFLEEIKGICADDGVVIANVFYSNRLFDAELKTFLAVFGRCQVFLGDYSSNAMLVSPGPTGPTLTVKEAIEQAKILQSKYKLAFDMLTVAKRLRPNIRPDLRAKVLTDDMAPVNWLQSQAKGQSPDDVP